jgi:uncharacterized protein with HEPN domain
MSKKDSIRLQDYLEHMAQAILRIDEYITDISEVHFLKDTMIQDAVIRNIEILGEAAHNIEQYHTTFAQQHSDIPWSDIYTMRNRISHGYFAVDLEVVWRTIENDLPELYEQIKNLRDQLC